MEQLRNRMISDFALGNYSPRTAKEYLRCVRTFTAHYMRCPSQLGKEEVRGFLHHLLETLAIFGVVDGIRRSANHGRTIGLQATRQFQREPVSATQQTGSPMQRVCGLRH